MSRGRRARQGAGVSLFPFLAVLLCTMGALIVLLVVIAHQARTQAAAPSPVLPGPGDVKRRAERLADKAHLESQIARLRRQLSGSSSDFQQAQRKTDDLEAERRRLTAELKGLAQSEQELAAGGGQGELKTLQSQIVRWGAQIRTRERELRDKKRKASAVHENYAIIPYDGPNGTRRRPIYIECRADGVFLQPEGTRLSEADFQVPARGNPLDSAVRVTAEQFRREGDTASQPYPLLLVRPDGILAYAAARQALALSGVPFGYELIDQDWAVKLPPSNVQLAARQQAAVQDARRRMAQLSRFYQGRTGFSPTFEVSTDGTLRRIGGGMGSKPGQGSGAGGGNARWGQGQGDGTGGLAGRGSSSIAGDTAGSRFGTDRFGAPGGGRSSSSRPDESFGVGQGGIGSSPNGGVARQPSGRSPFGQSAGSGEGPFGGTMGGPNSNSFASPSGGAPGSGPGGRGESPRSNFGLMEPFAGERGGRGQASAGSSDPSHGVQANGAAEGAGSGTSSQGPHHASAQGGPGGPNGGSGPPNGSPQPGGQPGNASNHHSIAASHGKNWALPERPSERSSPLWRNMRLVVDADTITIFADDRDARPQRTLRLRADTSQVIDEMKQTIWKIMDGWGPALPGMHWRPVLRAEVTPRGGRRFNDLNALLRDSGIVLAK